MPVATFLVDVSEGPTCECGEVSLSSYRVSSLPLPALDCDRCRVDIVRLRLEVRFESCGNLPSIAGAWFKGPRCVL